MAKIITSNYISKFLVFVEQESLTKTDYQVLDDMLTHALTSGEAQIAQNFEEFRSFWRLIAQGLIRLGGNPLPWMESMMKAKKEENNIPRRYENNFLMLAQIPQSIIFNLLRRSSYSGQVNYFLSKEWSQFVGGIEAFSYRLYDYLEGKLTYTLKKNAEITTQELDLLDQRIEIYLELLSLTDDILNKNLPEGSEVNDDYLHKTAQTLQDKMKQFVSKTRETRRYGANRGTVAAENFDKIFDDLKSFLFQIAAVRESKRVADENAALADENAALKANAVTNKLILLVINNHLQSSDATADEASFQLSVIEELLELTPHPEAVNQEHLKERVHQHASKNKAYCSFFKAESKAAEEPANDPSSVNSHQAGC